jgi:probable O-glycosylation ligase (exosortase A-associated)
MMGGALWLRARPRHKVLFAVLFAVAVAAVFQFAPPQWMERMATIKTYQNDASAESRLYFWQLSWAMAEHHPIFGAGFRWMYFPTIANSALADSGLPALKEGRAAHSIWFEMLGDHGFIGLFLFVGLIVTGLINAAWIVRRSEGVPKLKWANDLGRALQASIVGLAAGGSFASLAMWDGCYLVLIVGAAARIIAAKELTAMGISRPGIIAPKQNNTSSVPVPA